jgi:hypothetical protein
MKVRGKRDREEQRRERKRVEEGAQSREGVEEVLRRRINVT